MLDILNINTKESCIINQDSGLVTVAESCLVASLVTCQNLMIILEKDSGQVNMAKSCL